MASPTMPDFSDPMDLDEYDDDDYNPNDYDSDFTPEGEELTPNQRNSDKVRLAKALNFLYDYPDKKATTAAVIYNVPCTTI